MRGLSPLTGTPYQTYFDGAQFVHFLLGPATVSLAIPIYRSRARLRALWLPVAVAVVTGGLAAALSTVAVAALMGADQATLISLAPVLISVKLLFVLPL